MFCAKCANPVEQHDIRCANCDSDLRAAGAIRLTDPNWLSTDLPPIENSAPTPIQPQQAQAMQSMVPVFPPVVYPIPPVYSVPNSVPESPTADREPAEQAEPTPSGPETEPSSADDQSLDVGLGIQIALPEGVQQRLADMPLDDLADQMGITKNSLLHILLACALVIVVLVLVGILSLKMMADLPQEGDPILKDHQISSVQPTSEPS